MKSVFVLAVILCHFFNSGNGIGGPADHYSNQWILKGSFSSKSDVQNFALDFGFKVIEQVVIISNL